MNLLTRPRLAALAVLLSFTLAGCGGGGTGTAPTVADRPAPAHPAAGDDADIQAERDKLPADERALVAAQEWCAVSTRSRLGSMGPPLKVVVKDQPVYLCCEGCRKRALADPDKTLAAVAGLKAKAKP